MVERYKYILDQKKSLNERTFKIAAFYQAVTLAVATAQFKVVSEAANKSLRTTLAVDASWGLFIIFCFVSMVTVLLLVGGITAWADYKIEEEALEAGLLSDTRIEGRFFDFLKWYETYLIAAAILGVVLYLLMLKFRVLGILETLGSQLSST
ncbi:hypothetical protein ASG62_14355 [Aureimonas sp. Leaf427]|nr:hypothetical protein ASG62_14355 [Aureimonas sp. Leaf427]